MLVSNFGYLQTLSQPLYRSLGDYQQRLKLPMLSANTIDPNDANISDSLGHFGAQEVMEGRLPLWNHYEGIGNPSLAETQSAVMSPFTWLQVLPNGWLIKCIMFQLFAGLGLYFFLRYLLRFLRKSTEDDEEVAKEQKNAKSYVKIKLSQFQLEFLSTIGGCLFALCSTFILLKNACQNPVPFIGWHLLGVLLLFSKTTIIGKYKVPLSGMIIFTASLVFAFYSGFPETVYLNGLLAVAFFVVMLIRTKMWHNIAWALVSATIAMLVALPWIIEFVTYLHNSDSGLHDTTNRGYGLGNGANTWLAHWMPNIVGYGSGNPVYGGMGGWFVLTVLLLAIFGVIAKTTPLWVKLLFGIHFLLAWLSVTGDAFTTGLNLGLPGAKGVVAYRYIVPSMTVSLTALAIFGIYMLLAKALPSMKTTVLTLICFNGYVFVCLYASIPTIKKFATAYDLAKVWILFWATISLLPLIIISLIILFKSIRTEKSVVKQPSQRIKAKSIGVIAIIVLVIVQNLAFFSVWAFGAPNKGATVDNESIAYLQENLGEQRFYSSGAGSFNANYGSYYHIKQANMTDLPTPKLWFDHWSEQGAEVVSDVYWFEHIDEDSLNSLKAIGVKYIVVDKNNQDEIGELNNLSLDEVFTGSKFTIFELSDFVPYYRLAGNADDSCSVDIVSTDNATTRCDAPSTLIRSELNYPGWHVLVDGVEADLTSAKPDGSGVALLQKVELSAGDHTVQFYYWPQFMTLALIAALFGLIIWLSLVLLFAGVAVHSLNLSVEATPSKS